MARPLGDYVRAAEDAWLAKSVAMFRTSLNLQDYLRDHAAKAAREQANPPSSQRLQETAQQQWRTIEPQSSRYMEYTMAQGREAANANQQRGQDRVYPWTAEQVAVDRLSKDPNQQHRGHDHGQNR